MTSGIYALWWSEKDLIYIGQAINIEKRFKDHLYRMKTNGHSNYKVQKAYTEYGIPELVILEKSTLENLNNLEIQWTKEFDSITYGLNIIEGGMVGHGTNANASVYSKLQILKAFRLLYSTKLPYKDITSITGVEYDTLYSIIAAKSHRWILDKYPRLWKRIEPREFDKRSIIGKLITLVDPNKQQYTVDNLAEFSRTYYDSAEEAEKLRKGLSKLRSGILKSYKGWQLVN